MFRELSMKNKNLITICARGGFKGIKNKNILSVCGFPLISWTIACVRLWVKDMPVVVSTDSQKISNVASEFGVDVCFPRPPELAGDNVPKAAAITHVLGQAEQYFNTKFSHVFDLDVTAPLRRKEDLSTMVKMATTVDCDLVYSVCSSRRNPYYNMIEIDKEGYAHICMEREITSRQSAPKVYDVNASLYVYTSHILRSGLNPFTKGRCRVHVMPQRFSIDIDEPEDLEYVSYIMQKMINQKDEWFLKMQNWLVSQKKVVNVSSFCKKEDWVKRQRKPT
jgi:CMP-N-acetylneuraminic acid synthetase